MDSAGETDAASDSPSGGSKKEQTRSSWLVTPEEKEAKGPERLEAILADPAPSPSASTERYIPLMDTIRLYAGWLLAWYFLIYAVAGYQMTRNLPYRLGLLDDFLASALVAEISAALFLFLLLTSIHRTMRGGVLLGFLLGIMGLAGVLLFSVNMR